MGQDRRGGGGSKTDEMQAAPHPQPGNQRLSRLQETGSGKPSPPWRELDNDTSDSRARERSPAIKVSGGPVAGSGCCGRSGADSGKRCTPSRRCYKPLNRALLHGEFYGR